MKQWGSELRQAAAGDLPGQSKTRDLPPMEPGEPRFMPMSGMHLLLLSDGLLSAGIDYTGAGEEHVQDRVTVQETSAGESQRKAPSTTP